MAHSRPSYHREMETPHRPVHHIEGPGDQTWCGLRISRVWEDWEVYPPGELRSRFPPCEACDHYKSTGVPAPLREPDTSA